MLIWFFCIKILISVTEEGYWEVLSWSKEIVSSRKEKRFCFRSLPIDTRKIHQHVCRVGRTEEYEIQRQERLLNVPAVSLRLTCCMIFVLGQTWSVSIITLNLHFKIDGKFVNNQRFLMWKYNVPIMFIMYISEVCWWVSYLSFFYTTLLCSSSSPR